MEDEPRDRWRAVANIKRNAPSYYAHSAKQGGNVPFVDTDQNTAQHSAMAQWGMSTRSPRNHETRRESVLRSPRDNFDLSPPRDEEVAGATGLLRKVELQSNVVAVAR